MCVLSEEAQRSFADIVMTKRTTTWVGAALGVLLGCQMLAAFANPALLAEARKQLAAMNPKQAYMLLIAEQDRLAGNIEFDYLLGVAALDSGKVDESIIAFERVLAMQPNNAGAQLDLARAYFLAGSLDLAEATFRKLQGSNPPPTARMAIDKYLEAIAERRRAGRRLFNLWGETALGYDSNLTGVPDDFSSAVLQAFNFPGIAATGNSIRRKAPFLGAGVGADTVQPIGEKWNAYFGADARGRAYRNGRFDESDFNSTTVDARASAVWDGGAHQWRFNTAYNRFTQDGAAPTEPRTTNDRRTAVAGIEWRYNLNSSNQFTAGASGARTRFPTNKVEDFNSSIFSASWLRAFGGSGTPIFQLSGYYSRDKALYKLADGVTDKSKKLASVRSFFQYHLSDRLSWYTSVGWVGRSDDVAFARATQVERGRDNLLDGTLGMNWRFRDRCSVRAQWLYSRGASNIDIYDYTRNEVTSTVRCDFM